jgi:hypothetical protein
MLKPGNIWSNLMNLIFSPSLLSSNLILTPIRRLRLLRHQNPSFRRPPIRRWSRFSAVQNPYVSVDMTAPRGGRRRPKLPRKKHIIITMTCVVLSRDLTDRLSVIQLLETFIAVMTPNTKAIIHRLISRGFHADFQPKTCYDNWSMRWGCVVNSTSRPLYHREWPGTHHTGDWVGPRAGLEGCGKSHPKRDSIPGPSSP